MRSAYFKRGGLTTFLLIIIGNGADFGASPGKSEAVDASESERDVHQRGVRDNHETAESFGTRVAFCSIVDLAFDFRFARTRARSRELSLERFVFGDDVKFRTLIPLIRIQRVVCLRRRLPRTVGK